MHNLKLDRDEKLVRVFWQSAFVLSKAFLLSGVALFVSWYLIVKYNFSDLLVPICIFTGIIFLYLLREHKLWRLQKYVITSKRLIKVEHLALLTKSVTEAPLERILNVSYKTTGVVSAIGRFGDVEVQVVGLMEPIILKNIPRPSQIKDYLWKAHELAVKDTGFSPASMQATLGYTKKNQNVV